MIHREAASVGGLFRFQVCFEPLLLIVIHITRQMNEFLSRRVTRT